MSLTTNVDKKIYFISKKDKNKRCVYVYLFPDMRAYVGLTYNITQRNNFNGNDINSIIYKYIKKTNLMPLLIQLTDYIDIRDITMEENYYIEYYKKNGYILLNTSTCGALGNGSKKWNKERCQEESIKYNTRSEFRNNSKCAYNAASRNDWLNDICSHMLKKQTKKESQTKLKEQKIKMKKEKEELKINKFNMKKEKEIFEREERKKNGLKIDKMKTIVISDDIHVKMIDYCKAKNIKIGKCIEKILKNYLLIDDKSILPLILIDSDTNFVEKIECTSLSSDYKNSMPKELTLLRTTRDGSGYIGNYFLK